MMIMYGIDIKIVKTSRYLKEILIIYRLKIFNRYIVGKTSGKIIRQDDCLIIIYLVW